MSYTPDPQRYDGRMPYRRCGKSGLKLPTISLGFWHNFGDGDDLDGIPSDSRAAKEHGFLQQDAVAEKIAQVQSLNAIADILNLSARD